MSCAEEEQGLEEEVSALVSRLTIPSAPFAADIVTPADFIKFNAEIARPLLLRLANVLDRKVQPASLSVKKDADSLIIPVFCTCAAFLGDGGWARTRTGTGSTRSNMNENEEDLLHSNTLGGGKWTDSATRNAALNLESLLLTKIKINRNNKNNIHHIAPPGEESSPATSSPLVVEKGLEIERQADLDWVGAALAPRILTHRIAPMFKQQANVDQRLILNKSNSSSISSSSRSITADASYVTSVNLKAINIEGEVDDNPYQLRTISSSSSRPRVIDRREREKVDFADRPWKVQQVDTIPILYHLIFTLKFPAFKPIQHLLIPPILYLMDDYDADYKELGIDMFRYIFIDNMAAADVRMSGLGLLVWKSLEIHQTFYSNPSLVLAALSTLLALVPVIEIKGSLGYYDRFLLLLKFSVIRGLVMNRGGGRIDLTTAYLEIGVRVVNQVGILAAKYLEDLVSLCCEVVADHVGAYSSQSAALSLLTALSTHCSQRFKITTKTSMTKNHKEKEEVDEEEEEGCKDKNGNTIIINSRHTSKILAACLLCRAKYTYSFRINSHGSTAASSAAAEMMDRDRVLKQAWELCMNLKQQRYLGDDFEYAPHEWIVFEEQWRSIEVDEMR